MDYRKHGLKGSMYCRVFDALFERQQGKCFICGFKAELNLYPDNPQWIRNTNIHYLLYIDHSHENGCIRGLLCCGCNTILGWIENSGFKPKPETMRKISEGKVEVVPYPDELFEREIESAAQWLMQYQERILLYMQRERWLPRKDILAHLQAPA